MKKYCILLSGFLICNILNAQIQIFVDTSVKFQIIDGFGAFQGGDLVNQSWWQQLYFDDLESSIYRVDLTPQLKSPYSDLNCYSPWFLGSGTKSPFNLEDPANPDGPEGNRVRTYTGPNDYSRMFGGLSAPIAVMGPDIDKNIQYFTYNQDMAISTGKQKASQLGDFKLIASIWSPLPWVKISSGNKYPDNWWPGPVMNTPWPFIWVGNYAGGRLDLSDNPLQVFNDLSLGGSGPTSSITQFARSMAAYILGYQRFHQQNFYAISIQNELNFEEFYNSAIYPVSSEYITALKAIRNEFDKYPELKNIKLMGPEDLIGGDAYGMWEYGGPIHKNLQYLQKISLDTTATKALDFFCIHGYTNDGVSSATSNPGLWNWWSHGWTTSPAAGLPANVKGFLNYSKKSWMTESSGENPDWLYPKSGFPGDGGFGLAYRIHHALTAGMESAYVYWTFSDTDNNGNVSIYGMTNQASGSNSPKYIAAKHFFKFIRPNSVRVSATVPTSNGIFASAYLQDKNKSITLVLLNANPDLQNVSVTIPPGIKELQLYRSSDSSYWNHEVLPLSAGKANLFIPAYGVVTLAGTFEPVSNDNLLNATFYNLQIQPNPVSNHSQIFFKLNHNEQVKLVLYNYHGDFIKSILNKNLSSGSHSIDLNTEELNSGLFYLEMITPSASRFIKIIVIK